MKKLLLLLFVCLAFAKGNAQILDPAKWTSKIEKKSDNTYLLTFNAVIEDGWHLYSQFTPEGGPLPLEIVFKNQKGNFNLVGKAKESKTRTAFNDVFGVNEIFFEKKAQIQQEITVINPKVSKIEVDFNFQVCKEACINVEKNFSLTIPAATKVAVEVIETDTIKVDTIATEAIVATEKVEVPLEKTETTQPK